MPPIYCNILHYRTLATPLCYLHMRMTRVAAEATTSCPIQIEHTTIRAQAAN